MDISITIKCRLASILQLQETAIPESHLLFNFPRCASRQILSSHLILLSSFVLFCFVLFCFVLFCFVLFCFVLFCFVLFCFVLFCFVLFCFVLFCFVLFFRQARTEVSLLTSCCCTTRAALEIAYNRGGSFVSLPTQKRTERDGERERKKKQLKDHIFDNTKEFIQRTNPLR